MEKRHSIIFIILCAILCTVTNISRSTGQNKQNQKPKNVILLVAEGMSMAQITATMVEKGDDLNLFRIKNIGFTKNHTSNDLLPDPSAVATAVASGIITTKGAIGVDKNQNPVESILEFAKKNDKATGIITSSTLVAPTPAAFYAHQNSESKYEEIAKDLLNANLDVFMGGGRRYFKQSKDKNDLVLEFHKKGYKVVEEYKKLGKGKIKVAGFLAKDNLKSNVNGRNNFFSMAWQTAFRTLIKNANGYFVVIHNAHIVLGAHNNNLKMVVSEILELDELIGEILDLAIIDNQTLLIVVSSYDAGGLTIDSGNLQENKVNVKWSTKGNTGILSPVFAIGPGSEQFIGVYDNTDIFHKLKDLLK